MAERLLEQFAEDGSPIPFPEKPADVSDYVDKIAPGAVEDIGQMMAESRGSMIAMPKEVISAIEQGFRTRMTEVIVKSLGEAGS